MDENEHIDTLTDEVRKLVDGYTGKLVLNELGQVRIAAAATEAAYTGYAMREAELEDEAEDDNDEEDV